MFCGCVAPGLYMALTPLDTHCPRTTQARPAEFGPSLHPSPEGPSPAGLKPVSESTEGGTGQSLVSVLALPAVIPRRWPGCPSLTRCPAERVASPKSHPLWESAKRPGAFQKLWAQGGHSHAGAAPGGHDVEQGEGVDDEAQLLVREQRVQRHEAQRRQEQRHGPSVHGAQGHEEQAAAQAAGQGRVEVPQQGRGLRAGLRRPRATRGPVPRAQLRPSWERGGASALTARPAAPRRRPGLGSGTSTKAAGGAWGCGVPSPSPRMAHCEHRSPQGDGRTGDSRYPKSSLQRQRRAGDGKDQGEAGATDATRCSE